jgi:glycosyltransferase involved in cell wall biosynthesis
MTFAVGHGKSAANAEVPGPRLSREESPEELAEALTFLYRTPERRMEMGKAAMERARTQFSPTVVQLVSRKRYWRTLNQCTRVRRKAPGYKRLGTRCPSQDA